MDINGIVYRGKFYRALPIHIADLFEEMVNGCLRYTKVSYRMEDGELGVDIKRYRFRSPELTERLNNPKTKEK